MSGNAGKGREAGSRNRRTLALLELAEQGETPCAFALRVMRDDAQPHPFRVEAARIAAPYVHSKPAPEGEKVKLDLPDTTTVDGVGKASAAILSAVASGSIAVETGRNLVAILDSHRKGLELVEIERRIAALEKGKA